MKRVLPRKPEEGGVGSRGQAVTDCSQFHSDHRDADMKIKLKYDEKVRKTQISFEQKVCVFVDICPRFFVPSSWP